MNIAWDEDIESDSGDSDAGANGRGSRSRGKGKRKRREEQEDADEEAEDDDAEEEEDDETETAEDKRRRLAKEYLASMQNVDDDSSVEEGSQGEDHVSEALKKERLEKQGKYFRDLASQVASVEASDMTRQVMSDHEVSLAAPKSSLSRTVEPCLTQISPFPSSPPFLFLPTPPFRSASNLSPAWPSLPMRVQFIRGPRTTPSSCGTWSRRVGGCCVPNGAGRHTARSNAARGKFWPLLSRLTVDMLRVAVGTVLCASTTRARPRPRFAPFRAIEMQSRRLLFEETLTRSFLGLWIGASSIGT